MNLPRFRDGFSIAGWLFADLLLGLALLFTAAGGYGANRKLQGQGATSPTPTFTSTGPPHTSPPPPTTVTSGTPSGVINGRLPTPGPALGPRSVRLESFCWSVKVDADGLLSGDPVRLEGARQETMRAIDDALKLLRGYEASLVLTFGSLTDKDRAHRLSHEVNGLLRSEPMRRLPNDVGRSFAVETLRTRDYINLPARDLDGGMAVVWIEVFVPATASLPTPYSEEGCPR